MLISPPNKNYTQITLLGSLIVQDQNPMFNREARFIIILSLLLITGFTTTSLISYFVANNSLDEYIQTNTLPLTSDNIYSEIQRDVLPTVVISSLMAQDTFVRDWILAGEKNPDLIIRYLKNIQTRYKTDTAFFISDSTHNYYHSSGILKQVKKTDHQDSWYFKINSLEEDVEINVDTDTANMSQTSFFVNHKINDYEGNYLGAIGVGLSSKMVSEMIEYYQKSYDRQVYFADASGKITLHGPHYQGAESLHQTEGLSALADQVLTNQTGSYSYIKDGNEIFLKTRYIPELSWYLLVEQIGKPETHIQKTLWLNLLLSSLITMIVLLLAHYTISKYQQHLVEMAMKDKLTGINNRHAFDPASQQVIKTAYRNKDPLSIVLVDIDHFKNINDNHGHLVGDQVIVRVAKILQSHLRASDLLCRWGGEEFMILLPKCDIEHAQVLTEKIRLQIEYAEIMIEGKNISITASFGVTQYTRAESQIELVERVDKALYKAKSLGRNRVELI